VNAIIRQSVKALTSRITSVTLYDDMLCKSLGLACKSQAQAICHNTSTLT